MTLGAKSAREARHRRPSGRCSIELTVPLFTSPALSSPSDDEHAPDRRLNSGRHRPTRAFRSLRSRRSPAGRRKRVSGIFSVMTTPTTVRISNPLLSCLVLAVFLRAIQTLEWRSDRSIDSSPSKRSGPAEGESRSVCQPSKHDPQRPKSKLGGGTMPDPREYAPQDN